MQQPRPRRLPRAKPNAWSLSHPTTRVSRPALALYASTQAGSCRALGGIRATEQGACSNAAGVHHASRRQALVGIEAPASSQYCTSGRRGAVHDDTSRSTYGGTVMTHVSQLACFSFGRTVESQIDICLKPVCLRFLHATVKCKSSAEAGKLAAAL